MKEAEKLNDQIGRQLQVLDTALLQVIRCVPSGAGFDKRLQK